MAGEHKKTTAASTWNTGGSCSNRNVHNARYSIAESGGKVKPDWREIGVQQNYQREVERLREVKASVLLHLPVVYRGCQYPQVTAIIYSRYPGPARRIPRISVEMVSACSGSRVQASPKDVTVQTPPNWKLEIEPWENHWDKSLSQTLKQAMLEETPVICDDEEYAKITKVIYRRPPEKGIVIETEIMECRPSREYQTRGVKTVRPVSAQLVDPGTSAERCVIFTDGQETLEQWTEWRRGQDRYHMAHRR
ncbi:MAG: hypothetical protein [Chaetfec virus UA24_244]|nr:MAG: hypothetical protein [Chaetfec virus UA24_244]